MGHVIQHFPVVAKGDGKRAFVFVYSISDQSCASSRCWHAHSFFRQKHFKIFAKKSIHRHHDNLFNVWHFTHSHCSLSSLLPYAKHFLGTSMKGSSQLCKTMVVVFCCCILCSVVHEYIKYGLFIPLQIFSLLTSGESTHGGQVNSEYILNTCKHND